MSRFIASIDPSGTITWTSPDLPAWRQQRRFGWKQGGEFPLPQAHLPAPNDPAHLLCTDTSGAAQSAVLKRLLQRAPQGDDVANFGRYLFTTLLGPVVWSDLVKQASAAKWRRIELAIQVSPPQVTPPNFFQTQWRLHRLPWEMMCEEPPGGFLASDSRAPIVVITRLVANTPTEWPVRQASYPPRVLFVVGSSLEDVTIRPGAEIMALLRRLEERGGTIQRRVLQQATPARVRLAVIDFTPDVVHFICHGDEDGKGGFLYLLPDRKPPPGQDPRERCTGTNLLAMLAGEDDQPRPTLVTLSACYSSGGKEARLQTDHLAPLALELVLGGVPAVLGMAGRVADSACRLFTRRFGEVLVNGGSLVHATGEGRWAAFAESPTPPAESVDWAFPTVFLADRVPAKFAPVQDSATGRRIDDVIGRFVQKTEPVFCGRESIFDEYYRLFDKARTPRALGIRVRSVRPRLGKSRLIQELAVQALRDGKVPVMFWSMVEGWEPRVENVGQFAIEMLLAIEQTRERFEIAPPLPSAVLTLLTTVHQPAELAQLQANLAGDPALLFSQWVKSLQDVPTDWSKLSVGGLRKALAADFAALAKDAGGQVVVFLDEVGRYGKVLSALLVDANRLIDPTGLGGAPVVLTLSWVPPASEVLKPIENGMDYVRWVDLGRFESDGEAVLAYRQVLLHPLSRRPKPRVENNTYTPEDMPHFPWVVADNRDLMMAQWEKSLLSALRGLPESLAEDYLLYPHACNGLHAGHLKLANDEDLIGLLDSLRADREDGP